MSLFGLRFKPLDLPQLSADIPHGCPLPVKCSVLQIQWFREDVIELRGDRVTHESFHSLLISEIISLVRFAPSFWLLPVASAPSSHSSHQFPACTESLDYPNTRHSGAGERLPEGDRRHGPRGQGGGRGRNRIFLPMSLPISDGRASNPELLLTRRTFFNPRCSTAAATAFGSPD